ncbi:hypothetical protein [Bacillus litorisediminis]|uniref:hypothetical protein n=1 Tax=Bacillus litorisediminis TaxID=2922713 RepID=UPI001FAC83DD|nr:hypothetical protein [Bacillus litorisediminis]
MAVTGQQVFDMAMVLIDEVSETGNIVADNPEYYRARSIKILTLLQAELMRVSETPVVINDLSQNLSLSDKQCLTVLPYGLAAHLLIQEDVNTASFFNARYDELKRRSPATIEPITDVNNVLGGMQ